MDKVFKSLVFENSSGIKTILSDINVKNCFEVGYRKGFTAPDIELVKQTYANGVTKILKRIVKSRTISIDLILVEKNNAIADKIFFQMVDQLMDVSSGEIGKLYVRRSDGMTVYLNCAYSSGLKIIESYRNFHKFTLEFYAADPYFYRDLESVTLSLPDTSKLTLKDYILLGENHKLGEIVGDGSGVVTNNSSISIQPVIKAKSVNGNFSITNTTTNKSLELSNVYVAPTDYLIIDTRENSKAIYIDHVDGTKTPAGQYLNWDNINFDFFLVPGDNVLNFYIDVGSYTDGITFEMSEQYLSA